MGVGVCGKEGGTYLFNAVESPGEEDKARSLTVAGRSLRRGRIRAGCVGPMRLGRARRVQTLPRDNHSPARKRLHLNGYAHNEGQTLPKLSKS